MWMRCMSVREARGKGCRRMPGWWSPRHGGQQSAQAGCWWAQGCRNAGAASTTFDPKGTVLCNLPLQLSNRVTVGETGAQNKLGLACLPLVRRC